MMKRSVSPLIATIILIALTVALGAIIVGWARSYVSGQISATGAQVEILSTNSVSSGSGSTQYYLVNVTAENIGSTAINGNYLEIKLQDAYGNTYKCTYSSTNLPFSGGINCYIYNITNINGSVSYVGTSAPTITSNTLFIIELNVSPSVSLTGAQATVLYYDNEVSSPATIS